MYARGVLPYLHDPAGIPSKDCAQYVEVLTGFAALWSAPFTVWLGMSHSPY